MKRISKPIDLNFQKPNTKEHHKIVTFPLMNGNGIDMNKCCATRSGRSGGSDLWEGEVGERHEFLKKKRRRTPFTLSHYKILLIKW